MTLTPNQKRLLGYPVAILVAAGLGWAGFGYRAEADFGTLIGSASIHAELAASIPADSPRPDALELRTRLIADARGYIARAERVAPDTSAVCQVRAFIESVEGRNLEAAALYRQSRELDGCSPDQFGRLVMHEAKALSNADRAGDALALLDAHVPECRDEDQLDWRGLRSRLLFRLGRVEDARAEAVRLAERDDADSELAGATLLEGFGDFGAAESAFRKYAPKRDLSDYYVGRLKLRAGETDTAISLLERTVKPADPEVLNLARRDRGLWIAVVGAERFDELANPTGDPAAPGAGR